MADSEPPLTMDILALARQRKVMTTITDLIVAAAGDRSLRIAVACTDPHETVFADRLTRALHARGRPCRCLPPNPDPATADGGAPHRQGSPPTITVIASAASSPDETDVCRIDIHLHTPSQLTGSGGRTDHPESAGPDTDPVDGHRADIVVDYSGPDGPTIRHIEPALTLSPAGR